MTELTGDLKLKIKLTPEERRDPTSFLPEEPMSYEIKKKKKKKKKRQEDDPFKDIQEKALITERIVVPEDTDCTLDPEVTIKVENIEVELDFNDFANDGDLLIEHGEDSQEQPVNYDQQTGEAVLLTFESIINQKLEDSERIEEDVKPMNKGVQCKICHLFFLNEKSLSKHQTSKHRMFNIDCVHTCDTCGMAYGTRASLVAHIKRKHGPNADDEREDKCCDICYLTFKGAARLRMHMRRKHGTHQDSFLHVCEDCGLTYDKYRSLLVHRQRKHTVVKKEINNQWYNCPFCPKVFNKKETYARHMQRKHLNEENKDDPVLKSKNEAGEFTCQECEHVFSTANYLKLHMRRKHNALKENFRLKCRLCNLSYDKVESLKRHIHRKHNELSMYCKVCKKQFSNRQMYLKHSHVKTVKECSLCNQIFASEGGLAKHLRCTHKLDAPKVAFCGICNEGFYDKRQIRTHLLRVHYKVSYTCKYCKKVFKARASYRRHVLTKHENKVVSDPEQKQKCEQCSELFDDEFELCKHINIVHREADINLDIKQEHDSTEKNFTCIKCPEKYHTWEELRVHYKENHYNSCICTECGELVPGNKLKKHMKQIHPDNTELECRFCDFKTNKKFSMTQHTLRHKNASTLHCDYAGCRYKTYYEAAMNKHKSRHLDQGVKLQCSKCPFQTMNKYILKYHEDAHMTGKKKYACDQCDYSTILPTNLVQHKYKHSTEKRFKCDMCPFATKYNTSLRFHVKKKHCDLPS